jgi:hypothetical protein
MAGDDIFAGKGGRNDGELVMTAAGFCTRVAGVLGRFVDQLDL